MNTKHDIKQFNMTITGKVQGVFYRASTAETARKLGIKGWVKNNPDGSVQIAATGTSEQLQALLAWCRQGPSRAEVAQVTWEEHTPESFEDFTVRH